MENIGKTYRLGKSSITEFEKILNENGYIPMHTETGNRYERSISLQELASKKVLSVGRIMISEQMEEQLVVASWEKGLSKLLQELKF
ncbi:hypothetical protein KAJ87_03935 [Candidatus Pacearchaeota archaeon]|nr:hypothetical protein [Candidatus Pacearchaeota archaeon]